MTSGVTRQLGISAFMKRPVLHLATFFLVAGLLISWATGALAETRMALVVGNGQYKHTAELANPANDARDVSQALKSAGFEVIEAIDADKRGLDAALRAFTEKLVAADVALFFYAGHGLQVGAQNYLVPTDAKLARERDLEFEAVRVDFVLRQMEIDREGRTTIVILDACRDNPLARNLARSMGTRSAGVGRGLAQTAAGVGTFVAFATQPGNVALDGDGRNSPFSKALAKHMRTRGLNLPATMVAVRKDVIAETDGRQVPWDHSALTGDFYFIPTGAAPAAGTAQTAPAASGSDMAALQERLRRLEEAARERESRPASGTMLTADGIRLAELRARAASLNDLVKDLQTKLFTARREEGKATDAAEKQARLKKSMDIQAEMTRRSMDLKKVRDEIAVLEGGGSSATKKGITAAPPVQPAPDPDASAADFSQDDNVRIEGSEIRSSRASSPDACRNTCAAEAGCVGYQHGRKIPVMGTCTLFSSIDARHEDKSWRSGVRGAARSDAVPATVLLPPELLGQKPLRTEQGFKVFEGAALEGDMIKMATADSARACVTVCRNTAGCIGATFLAKSGELGNMCTTYSRIARGDTGRNGAYALIRN